MVSSKRHEPGTQRLTPFCTLLASRQVTPIFVYVARFVQNPGKHHWTAVKHILHYLQGTASAGITLGGPSRALHDYPDSGCPDTRRSTSGYIFYVNGGPISWKCQRQEYIALSHASAEALWLRNLLKSLSIPLSSTRLYGDNKGGLILAKNPHDHPRTKHIDVHYHFTRHHIHNGNLSLTHIPGTTNQADALTKSPPVLSSRRQLEGVCQNEASSLIGESVRDPPF